MKIYEFFKNLFYDSHLEFLNEKDIIWAKRYNTEEEMFQIAEGHRESPYVIIHKKGRKVYGLELGSNKSSKSIQLLKLKYKRKYGYNLFKDGYIFVGKLNLLNKDRFIRKLGVIDDEDLNRIYKSIYLINHRFKTLKVHHFPKRKLKFYYEVGDIIQFEEETYYIEEIDTDYFFCRQIHATKKGWFNINGLNYKMNYSIKKKIPKDAKIKLLNITDESIQKNIELSIKVYEKQKVNRNILNRGKLIFMAGKYYYIYGEYQNKLLAYKVYLDREMNEDMCEIIIKNGTYYTLFEQLEIIPKDNIKIIRQASEREMDAIKNLKKKIKETNQKNKTPKPYMYKIYKPGYILLDLKNLDRYIILKRYYNKIIYASLDDISNTIECDFENTSEFPFEVIEKMDKYKFKKILDDYDKIKNIKKKKVKAKMY